MNAMNHLNHLNWDWEITRVMSPPYQCSPTTKDYILLGQRLQAFADNTLVLHSTQKTISNLVEKVITFYGTNNAMSYGNISMFPITTHYYRTEKGITHCITIFYVPAKPHSISSHIQKSYRTTEQTLIFTII